MSDRRSQFEYDYDTGRRGHALWLRNKGVTLKEIGFLLGVSREQARRLLIGAETPTRPDAAFGPNYLIR